MSSAITTGSIAVPAPSRVNGRRSALVLTTLAGLALTAGFGGPADGSGTDPDLVRLLQFMAILKGVFALVAVVACFWRLGRPATAWREAVYVCGPALMAAGAVCLWTLQATGFAAIALHVGLFALLAAALTDDAFIPALKRRSA